MPSRSGRFLLLFFKYIRPCVAEFLGTMLFVFMDVCSGTNGRLSPGFTHAFILFVVVAATARVRYRFFKLYI